MIINILRKIYHYPRNRGIKKRKENLKKLFPTSRVAWNVGIDNKTVLEGYNIIYNSVSIRGTKIGYGSYICSNSLFNNCIIGRFSSIAGNTKVLSARHPIDFVSTSPSFFNTVNDMPFGKGTYYFDERSKCPNGRYAIIGNDVWIGEDVTLMGGVIIGDGAIIGAGAIVTKDIPPYTIVGGVPAKVIRCRFDQNVITKLLKIKWWDWPLEIIKERREEFIDVHSFVEKYYEEKHD